MLSKLPSAKVLVKLEFDTKDQVFFVFLCKCQYQQSKNLVGSIGGVAGSSGIEANSVQLG